MGDIVKLALRLFVFALVAAVALALTNEVTKGPIEAQKLAAKMDALNTVLPGCEYAQIEYEGLAEGSVLDEIFEAKDASGATVGYALTAAPQGYGGPIPITVGISTEGCITQTYVGALQETAGLGCGLLLFWFRFGKKTPAEWCSFAILLMNVVSPLIERVTGSKSFGEVKK